MKRLVLHILVSTGCLAGLTNVWVAGTPEHLSPGGVLVQAALIALSLLAGGRIVDWAMRREDPEP